MPQLLNNASANGASAQWGGGKGLFSAVATWGGGSVQLQYMGPDGSTWLNVGSAVTANGVQNFELPPGLIRAAVTAATAAYAAAEQTKG